MPKGKTGSAGQVLRKLRSIQGNRSKRSNTMDKSRSNKHTKTVGKLTKADLIRFIKHPGSMDIKGVDTRKKRK